MAVLVCARQPDIPWAFVGALKIAPVRCECYRPWLPAMPVEVRIAWGIAGVMFGKPKLLRVHVRARVDTYAHTARI